MQRNPTPVESTAEVMLATEGFDVDKESHGFKKLCRELLKVGVLHAQIEQKRSMGDYDDDVQTFGSAPLIRGVPHQLETDIAQDSISISKLFDEFEKEMLAGKRWREKTRRENRAMANTLVELLGDLPVATLDKATARGYKARLQNYPKNRNKDKRYRSKPIEQILAMPGVDTISVTTVNNQLVKLSAMGRWAVDQGYTSSNPFENLTIRTSSRAIDDVLPFDKEDLEKIFGSQLYRDGKFKHPWQFWIAPIGLFSGMRLEEICQLYTEDIREIDGVWCFDVNDQGERQLKTKSSKRVVPIHPELVRMGLLRYVESVNKLGKKRLFPELGKSSGKFSHYPSKWFGTFKRTLGYTDRRKSFHSFRHTFTSKLRENRAEDYLMKRLLGHEVGSVTHDRYEPKPMSEVLKQVDFGIDLSPITWLPASPKS